MDGFVIRNATFLDVPFLIDTIFEAEKSGTDKLSYSTVFGLSEENARMHIENMLFEDVDNCELSVSSFQVAERNGRIAAASAAWIEGLGGIPSSVLKGNLLTYALPKECIERAIAVNHLLSEIHFDYLSGTMQLGLVFVSSDFRGLNLTGLLIDEQISRLQKIDPNINEMYVQVFGNNIPAINAYEKANFKIVLIKESLKEEITSYLPSNKKILMKKELFIT
jgi:ribosomal protein S18 acetylase RimI-like enzyme